MKKLALFAMLVVFLSTGAPTFAWSANETDLVNTGFSPEIIRVSNLQRSRMEDMEPIQQERTRCQQFWWNVYHNDWLGSTYLFGHQVIKY
ncbi:MAG: hypothetical protein AB1782_03750 [Cyanobacteriota bacterium]